MVFVGWFFCCFLDPKKTPTKQQKHQPTKTKTNKKANQQKQKPTKKHQPTKTKTNKKRTTAPERQSSQQQKLLIPCDGIDKIYKEPYINSCICIVFLSKNLFE